MFDFAALCRRQTAKSVTAIANLKRLCEEHLPVNTTSGHHLLINPQLAAGTRSWRFRPWCGASRADQAHYRRSLQHRTRLVGLDLRPRPR